MPANLKNSIVATGLEKARIHSNPKEGQCQIIKSTTQLHSSHMLAKYCSKFSKPGFKKMWTMNFQMFKLDLEKAEEPEIKLPTFVGSSKKARDFQRNIHFCCIDYAKIFDWVDHHNLWKILQVMGILDHLTCVLRNLYAGQEATVRPGHGTTDWFQIGKGVRRGCILSPRLLTYMESTVEKTMAPHSSILAWKIPWMEEPGRLQSMGL